MSFKDQVVELIIKGRDLFSSEAKKSEKALAELAQQSEVLNEKLTELEDFQQAADSIDGLTRSISKGEQAYKESSLALDKLVTDQKQAVAETKKLDKAHRQATEQTDLLEQQYKQASVSLSDYEKQLVEAKAKVAKLSNEQARGASASKEQADALDKANAELKQLELAQANTESSAKELNLALDKQRRDLLELSDAAEKAGAEKAEYTLKVKQARTALNKLGTSIGKNQSELERQTKKLTSAGYSMDKLADASKDLAKQQAAAKLAVETTNKKLSRHEKLLNTSSKTAKDFGGSIGSATQNLLAMAGAYIGIDRLWVSLKGILSAGDRFEAFSLQMTSMMGSIASGEQATAWIKEFSNNTGTKLDEARDAFVKLKAFGIDPMNGSLQSLVDYNALLGGSQEKLRGIIIAVGQAWAKQKLQGEEILQLVERGVPVWQLLEKVTGKNVVQLQKLSEKGQLGRETIKALYEELGKQSTGLAAKSLERLSGQINLISNKFEEFKVIIADSGVYQVAVDFLKDLNQQFDTLNKEGKIKAAAEDISQFFSGLIRDSGDSLKQTLENITAFTTGLNAVSGGVRLFANVFTSIVATMAQASTAAIALILTGWQKLFETLGQDELAAKFEKVVGGMNAVSKAFADQVKQDAIDATAAFKQMGADIRLDSDGTTQTQIKNSEQVKEATKSEAEARLTAYQQDVEVSTKLLNDAGEQVKSWRARTKAAKDYYRELSESGTASQEQLTQAQQALEEANLKLSVAQSALTTQSEEYADSIHKLNVATLGLRETQHALANGELKQVRDAYIAGNASVEDYKAAQDKAKKSAEALAKAQKELSGEIDNTAASSKALETAMSKAGITTIKGLKEQKKQAKATFEAVKKGAKDGTVGTYELEQAFLKYAEASIQVSAATDQQAEASLRQQAAALGLTGNIDALIERYYKLKDAQRNLGNQTSETAGSVQKDSTGIGTTISNTMGLVVKSAEQAGSSLGSVARFFTDFATEVFKGVKELGEGTVAYFRTMRSGVQQFVDDSSELEKVQQTVGDLTDEIRDLNHEITKNVDFVGLSTWAKSYKRDAKIAQKAYYEQKVELLRLVDALEKADGANSQLIKSSEWAAKTMGLMNEQDLDQLNDAIDGAKSRMEDLRETASDTLSGLQDELDEFEGRQSDIERRKYEKELSDIREQLRQAEVTKDQQLIEKLKETERVLNEVYKHRTDQLKGKQTDTKVQNQSEPQLSTSKTHTQPKTTPPSTEQTYIPAPSYSQEPVAVFQLQIGSKTLNASAKRNLLNELITELNRQQQLGG